VNKLIIGQLDSIANGFDAVPYDADTSDCQASERRYVCKVCHCRDQIPKPPNDSVNVAAASKHCFKSDAARRSRSTAGQHSKGTFNFSTEKSVQQSRMPPFYPKEPARRQASTGFLNQGLQVRLRELQSLMS
jgi:hypothetical protein